MINIGNVDLAPSENIIEIRDKKQVIKARYVMDSKDIHKQDLMSEHYIEISFQLDISVKFVRGDYIMIEGSKFMLRKKHKPTQVNKHKFTYTLKFEAREMLAQDAKLYYIRQNLKEVTWSLTSDAPSFVKIAVDSLNRYLGKNEFQVGLVEPIGTKLINFDDLSVWDGLVEIAKVFEGEFYFTGNILNLVNKFSYGSEIEFENEVSVASMSQSEGENSNDFNRIVALGSTRNIPANYRETSSGEGVDAIYQKRLRIPVSKGDVIDAYPDMSPEEIVEGSVIFDDVYPKRVGTMSNITTVEYTDTDEETGIETKWNAFRYKDTGLNFKEEYILPGKELRIYFQKSKRLNGLDFAVKFNPDGKPESSPDAQVFEIVRNEDYGKALPNENLYPEAGDEYILYGFNIQLVSDAYIPAAEQELYERAVEWLANNIKDTSVFECPTVIQHFAVNSMDLEIGQKVKLINSLLDVGYRSSRIMGFEKKLINKYDAIYTVGDNAAYSRLSSIEKQIDELKYAGQIYQQTGSSGVYVIKQFDTTTPTDFNVYSAKASNAKYLKRDQEDSALRKITFADGIDVKKGAVSDMFGNDTFTSGQFGSGFRMWKADNGQSYAELDNLLVRREMIINTLTIAEIKSVGGQILVSLANMYVTKVEELADSYRCYFDTDNGTIQNQFALDDQVICRKFNGQGIKYYWSRVLGIGSDYIRLSKVDKDGSGIPSEGDELIQFGNRTNAARQSTIMISAYGSDAPSIKQYGGINTYNLTGKEVTVISPSGNKFTGQFQISTNGTTSVVYKDRGSFSNVATYYLNDRISYNGAYWVCIAPEGQSTSEIPSTTALYWRQDTTSQGDINNAIDNIQIGGTNLLSGTADFIVGDIAPNYLGWGVAQSDKFRGNVVLKMAAAYQGFRFLNFPDNKLPYECTLSFYAKVDSGSTEFRSVTAGTQYSILVNSTDWKQYSIVLPSGALVNNAGRNGIMETWSANPVYISSIKLERGNKASDWSRSNQEIQDSINNAQNTANNAVQRVTVAESNITVLQNEIKQTVKQSDFNSLEGRVSTAESNIVQQAGQIALTVEKVEKKNAAYKSYTSASTDRPAVPYSKGDIWITYDGTIKQAQNTRLSGAFVDSDWVDTTKYTDDTAINNLEIGGVNLLKGTGAFIIGDIRPNYSSWGTVQAERFRGNIVLKTLAPYWGFYITSFASNNNKLPYECTLSFYARVDSGSVDLLSVTAGTQYRVTVNSTEWKQYSVVFPAGAVVSNGSNGVLETWSSNPLYYSSIKLEKGNKATDWSANPEDMQLGGRNYVLGSDLYITSGIRNFSFSSIKEWRGKQITLSVDVEVVNGAGNRIGFEPSLVYADGTTQYMGVWYYISQGANFKGRISKTFIVSDKEITRMEQTGIYIQCTGALTKVGRPKLEEGNIVSDWSPAPEDVQAGIDKAQETADSKNRTFYSDSQPSTPSGGFKVGDMWYKINTIDGYYESYRWNGSAWQQVNVYVSKAKQVITDSSITNLVEKTGINSLGNGETLYSKINQTAEQITLEVNKIQVGGSNLLKGTGTFVAGDILPNYSSWGVPQTDKFRGNTILKITSAWWGFRFPNFPDNKLPYECVLSFFARVDSGSTTFTSITQGGFSIVVNSTEWKQYSIILPAGTVVNNASRQGIMETTSNNPVYYSSIQLEKGNKASDWSPASDDVKEDVRTSLVLNENGIWLNGDTIAQAIRAETLQVGNLTIEKDGTLKAVNGEFSGSLKGVTGSFKKLQAVNDNGIAKAEIGFNSDEGKMYFSGDMQHQGYDSVNQRSYRFLTSDLWCRGNFGTYSSNTLYIVGSYGYYYTKGLNKSDRVYVSLQSGVSSNNITYYTIPLYGTTGDASGFPVDMVIINASAAYNYVLSGPQGKQITVINSNDKVSSYVFCMGNRVELVGGAVRHFYNVDGFYSPALGANVLGKGWITGAVNDNTWS